MKTRWDPSNRDLFVFFDTWEELQVFLITVAICLTTCLSGITVYHGMPSTSASTSPGKRAKLYICIRTLPRTWILKRGKAKYGLGQRCIISRHWSNGDNLFLDLELKNLASILPGEGTNEMKTLIR